MRLTSVSTVLAPHGQLYSASPHGIGAGVTK
jgi:hypothetical protein